jgi:hypothetical protein
MAARGTVSNRKRVAKQGWLKKKGTGKKGVGRTNWTKRWLVLTDGAIDWSLFAPPPPCCLSVRPTNQSWPSLIPVLPESACDLTSV